MGLAKPKPGNRSPSPELASWRCDVRDVRGEWVRSLAVRRWLCRFSAIGLALAGLYALGLSWAGLPIVAVLTYPYRFVLAVGPEVLRVRWLFLRRTIALDELEAPRFELDSRLGYLGRRPLTLAIPVRPEGLMIIRAPEQTLRALAARLDVPRG